jgi:hypothetical protein
MEHRVRERLVKPSRTGAFGLPIGMPWILPSEFARARQFSSFMRLKPSLVNSHLLTQAAAGAGDRRDVVLPPACGSTLQETSLILHTGRNSLIVLDGPSYCGQSGYDMLMSRIIGRPRLTTIVEAAH